MGILNRRNRYETYSDMEKLIKSDSPKRLATYFIFPSSAENSKEIYNCYSNLIRDAVHYQSMSVIKLLLDKKLADASDGLRHACSRNNDALIDFFISKGAQTFPDDEDSLGNLIGNEEKFQKLIDLGAPVQNAACFMKIAGTKDKNAYADLLIQNGAKPEELPNAGDILLAAVKSGNMEFTHTLLSRGVSPDNANIFRHLGNTSQPLESYSLLLKYGAKPENLAYDYNNTFLHMVCDSMNAALFDHALDYAREGRLDINAVNDRHESALHVLISGRSDSEHMSAMVQKLLDAGIDIDICDANKKSALHLAVQYGQLAIVKLLVRHDADLTLENKEGHTPLSLAQDKKQDAICDFIKATAAQKENWARLDDVSIARIAAYTPAQKKFTEIFNFESQERMTIIDDLSPERPSVALRHAFAEIKPQILQKAFDHYKKQDGALSEAEALGGFDKNGANSFLLKG